MPIHRGKRERGELDRVPADAIPARLIRSRQIKEIAPMDKKKSKFPPICFPSLISWWPSHLSLVELYATLILGCETDQVAFLLLLLLLLSHLLFIIVAYLINRWFPVSSRNQMKRRWSSCLVRFNIRGVGCGSWSDGSCDVAGWMRRIIGGNFNMKPSWIYSGKKKEKKKKMKTMKMMKKMERERKASARPFCCFSSFDFVWSGRNCRDVCRRMSKRSGADLCLCHNNRVQISRVSSSSLSIFRMILLSFFQWFHCHRILEKTEAAEE